MPKTEEKKPVKPQVQTTNVDTKQIFPQINTQDPLRTAVNNMV
jgi:hypothetical protein